MLHKKAVLKMLVYAYAGGDQTRFGRLIIIKVNGEDKPIKPSFMTRIINDIAVPFPSQRRGILLNILNKTPGLRAPIVDSDLELDAPQLSEKFKGTPVYPLMIEHLKIPLPETQSLGFEHHMMQQLCGTYVAFYFCGKPGDRGQIVLGTNRFTIDQKPGHPPTGTVSIDDSTVTAGTPVGNVFLRKHTIEMDFSFGDTDPRSKLLAYYPTSGSVRAFLATASDIKAGSSDITCRVLLFYKLKESVTYLEQYYDRNSNIFSVVQDIISERANYDLERMELVLVHQNLPLQIIDKLDMALRDLQAQFLASTNEETRQDATPTGPRPTGPGDVNPEAVPDADDPSPDYPDPDDPGLAKRSSSE